MSPLTGEVTADEICHLLSRRGVRGLRDLLEPLTDHLSPNWHSRGEMSFTPGAERVVFKALLLWVDRGGFNEICNGQISIEEAKQQLRRLSVREMIPEVPRVVALLAVRVFGERAEGILEQMFFGQKRVDVLGRELDYNTHGVVEAISQYVEAYPHRVTRFTEPAAEAIARGDGFERDCEALLQALPDPDDDDDDEFLEESVMLPDEDF